MSFFAGCLRAASSALLIATLSLHAHAADDAARGAARQLAQSGVEAFQERNYAVASEKLERAYAVLKVPSVGLWSARALEKRGKWVEASERYLEATRLDAEVGEVQIQKQARADAESERQALLPRIPTLSVSLSGATPQETRVTIDGEAWPNALLGEPRPTNPGEHQLRAERGVQVVSVTVTLSEGAVKAETLRFDAPSAATTPTPSAAASATPSSTRRTLGFVALGVGGAGLIAGSITGALVASRHGDLEASCNAEDVCDPGRQDDIDAYNSLRTISTVSFIAGAVLGATGLTLVLTSPRAPAHAQLIIDPTSLRLRARF